MKRLITVIAMLMLICTVFGDWKVDENFESGEISESWTIIDGDDGSTWSAFENVDYAHNGSWMAFSDSYNSGQDNWLILPQTTIDAGDEVSMYIRSWYSTEEFEILVSVEDNEINDFDDELIAVDDQEGEYTLYSFDLSEYTGQEIYVGIHWICDSYSLLVDDVKLGQAGGGNTAPEINLPSEFSFDENNSLSIDFSEYVSDAEGDDLTLSFSDNDEVNVTIDDMLVGFTAQADWFGEDVMLFYVSDGEFEGSDFLTVIVNEVGGNTAPEIDLPDEFSFDENSSLTVDFSEYVNDVDDDDLTLSVSSNNEVNVEITGLSVVFTAEPDWYGEDVMMFEVSDGEFSDSDFLTVVVNEVAGNTPPELNLPAEFTFVENSSLTVDFSEYVSDEDGDELTISVSSNNEVIVEITGLEVVFSAEADWFGEDVMMFEVSDGEFEDSDFLTVIVTEAPEPGWKVDEGFEDGIIPADWTIIDGDDGSTWSAFENVDYAHNGSWMAFSDSYDSGQENWLILPQVDINNGDELSLYIRSWYSTEEFEILVSVEDNEINDFDDELIAVDDQEDEYTLYNFDLTEYTGQQIYVAIHWICDSYSLLVDDVKLGQNPGGNTPPEIDLPDSITFAEDTEITMDFSEYISDAEGDELSLSVTGNENIAVAITGLEVVFSAEADWFGEELLTFTVNDGEYSATDDLNVIVTDVADHIYGDVDDNGVVESYDASLLLQYVVGFDPAPAAPLPWEDWRLTMADVDGNGSVSAYDAALILQYIVGIITEFPAESGIRSIANAEIRAEISGNMISFSATGELYSFMTELPLEFTVINVNVDAISAVNHENGRLALAAAVPMNGVFLQIAIDSDMNIETQKPELASVNGNPVILTFSSNEPGNDLPVVTALQGNYPNPFNPSTEIRFSIAAGEKGNLSIYNVRGEQVHSSSFVAGEYNYHWDAAGNASGIYYYRLHTAENTIIRKMTLLK